MGEEESGFVIELELIEGDDILQVNLCRDLMIWIDLFVDELGW